MIRVEQSSRVSAHIKRRSATMEVERLSPTKFRVKPSEKGKVVRIVEFFTDGRDAVIDCYAEDTGRGCGANDHARFCSHSLAAIEMLLREES